MAIEKFTINVSDALLADLRRRLDATRWPDELENVGWELGSSLSYMKSLADYWRNAYEWRRQEATLNQLPQYRVALDGFHVHFVHVRSKDLKPLPVARQMSSQARSLKNQQCPVRNERRELSKTRYVTLSY
jgi:Epoxide hydrolase N terminus